MRVHRLIVLSLTALFMCGAVRQDEFLCEEAHARLVECCPGFHTEPGYCTYSDGCGDTTYPALTSDESECVRRASCEALRSGGLCTKLAERKPFTDDSGVQGPRVECR